MFLMFKKFKISGAVPQGYLFLWLGQSKPAILPSGICQVVDPYGGAFVRKGLSVAYFLVFFLFLSSSHIRTW